VNCQWQSGWGNHEGKESLGGGGLVKTGSGTLKSLTMPLHRWTTKAGVGTPPEQLEVLYASTDVGYLQMKSLAQHRFMSL